MQPPDQTDTTMTLRHSGSENTQAARGMRIWLKVMAVVCLLSAALLAYGVLSQPHLFSAFDVHWPITVLMAAVVFALLTLTCLSFAVARGLGLLASVAAQLAPYQSHECERGDDTAAPPRDEPSNMRDWLHVMGVLCLLPAPLLAHHIWSEIAFAGWANLLFLAPIPFGLITLSSLSFAGAESIALSDRISAHLPPLQPPPSPEQAAGSESGESAETAPPAREGWGKTRVWLQAMGVLCLLPAPLIAYGVLSDQLLYEEPFPRWGWADLVFVGTIVFGLVTLSCLSFAAVKNLDLLERIGAQLPPLHPPPSAQRGTAELYVMGVLCLLPTPLVAFHGEEPFPALAMASALVTLSCLSFAVAKGMDSLLKIAAHVPRLQPLESVPQTVETVLEEDVTTTPSPTQPEKEPPLVPPAGPPARPALSSRARRLLFIAVGIIALTAVALVSYHLDPMHGWAHYNRGVALAGLGRYEEALAAYERAIQLGPDFAWAPWGRGTALAELGRHEEALAAYDRAIQLDPDLAGAHGARGATLMGLGRYEEALAAYDREIALHPYEARAHYDRGWTLGKLGRYEEALAAFDRAIQLEPGDAKAHGNRGNALGELGRYEEALAAFDRAIELEPDLASARHDRGWALGELGRHEEALAAFDWAIQSDPYNADAHHNRGWALGQLGRHEEALAAFDRAIELGPDDAGAHHKRAWSLAQLGRYEEALAAYDRAIQLAPGDATAHHGRGWSLAQLGRHQEALAALDRAIELSPETARTHYAHYDRACVYSLIGSKDEALRNLRTAIDLDRGLRDTARTDDDFESIHGDPEFRELLELDDASSN